MNQYNPLFPNRQLVSPFLDPQLSRTEAGRQTIFGTALANMGFQGNQYDKALKLYEPQFGKFLAYQGNQLQGGAQAPTWVDFINQNFDAQRAQIQNPGLFGRQTPQAPRYFYR